MIQELHPDFNAFNGPGGLFDVSNPEMEANIGRTVQFNEADCLHRAGPFRIIGIQRIWDDSIAYRVVRTDYEDTTGCPARPDAITFIEPVDTSAEPRYHFSTNKIAGGSLCESDALRYARVLAQKVGASDRLVRRLDKPATAPAAMLRIFYLNGWQVTRS
jgi:hypothetical protein